MASIGSGGGGGEKVGLAFEHRSCQRRTLYGYRSAAASLLGEVEEACLFVGRKRLAVERKFPNQHSRLVILVRFTA